MPLQMLMHTVWHCKDQSQANRGLCW